MRIMGIGRQSMYDTFGDKRALFLRALQMYVTGSVNSISAELERPGGALSAVQNALVTFAEREDLSSAEGCMGLNAIAEFGQRDREVTRITVNAARRLRQALTLTHATYPDSRSVANFLTSRAIPDAVDFFIACLTRIRYNSCPSNMFGVTQSVP